MLSFSSAPNRDGVLFHVVLALLVGGSAVLAGVQVPLSPAAPRTELSFALPLQFVANDGVAPADVALLAESPAGTLAFDRSGVAMTLAGGQSTYIQFHGAETTAVVGTDQAGVVNRYVGAPESWRSGIPSYAGLRYQALYAGIDLVYEGRDGALKSTYFVAPQADPAQLRWSYRGATDVDVASNGDVQVALGSTTLTEAAPIAWQTIGGKQVPVEASYVVAGDGTISFALGSYNHAQPLVIDPMLRYSTYVGGSSDDWARAVATDNAGNVVITGYTYSTTFPGRAGDKADTDVFITKLNAAGTAVLYSTLIGGGDSEEGFSVAVDAAGNAWVTGYTRSENFALKNAISSTYSGGSTDTFVVKVDTAGAVLVSSYLGEESSDQGNDIAVDNSTGNAYIGGYAYAQFGKAAMVAKLDAAGSNVMFKRFFGQAERGFDRGTTIESIAVNANGQVYATGTTNTIAFPLVNPLQKTCGDYDSADDCNNTDAFVSVLNAAGTSLVYSTYLGGSASDEGNGIALDKNGNIYLAGNTGSANFPTANAWQKSRAGADNFQDAFISKLTPNGDKLVYSTYFGGKDWEEARGIAVDQAGNAYVTGLTSSADMPLAAPVQNAIKGICIVGSNERSCYDAYVAHFNANGQLAFSSYLGGNYDDSAEGIAVDAAGNVYIAGHAESNNFPTTAGSYQPGKIAQDDAFVAKFGSVAGAPQYDNKVFIPFANR